MKNLSIVLLLLLLFACSNGKKAKDKELTNIDSNKFVEKINKSSNLILKPQYLEFIGYYKSFPVYIDNENRIYYQYESKLTFIKQFDSTLRVHIFSEVGIIYSLNKEVFIEKDKEKRKIICKSDVFHVATDHNFQNLLLELMDIDNLLYYNYKKDTLYELTLKGTQPIIADSIIYYFQYFHSTNDESSPFVHLNKAKLVNFSSISLFNNKFFDQFLIISPKYNYLFCYIDNNGPKPVVIDLKKSSLKKIETPLDKFNVNPYFSFDEKYLIFYNSLNINDNCKIEFK